MNDSVVDRLRSCLKGRDLSWAKIKGFTKLLCQVPDLENRVNSSRLLCQAFGGCLLEIAPHNTSVAVRKIRTLHHQDVSNILDWINPCLRAPRSAMAKCAWRKHCRHASVRRA